MLPEGCAERCPACPHRGLSQAESEKQKNSWLKSELAEWGHALGPIVSPQARWGYRRKTLLHARFSGGAWAFGMIRFQGKEKEFVPVPHCPLHHSRVNGVLGHLQSLLPEELPLAFVLVSGEALTLVLKCTRRAEWLELMRSWEAGWPGESLFVNWNPVAGKRAIDSRRNELVFGPAWLESEGIVHGPSAFRQQIPEMEARAAEWAEEFLAGAGASSVLDLYCGLGSTLRRWGRRGWRALGVELSGESLEAARRNAPGAELWRGRVEDRLGQIGQALAGADFVVFTNPPRSGHGPGALEWLKEYAPARIAYLSCHPRSLAGDLRSLSARFRVVALRPLDFFPQTGQAETLALLERL